MTVAVDDSVVEIVITVSVNGEIVGEAAHTTTLSAAGVTLGVPVSEILHAVSNAIQARASVPPPPQ